MATVFTKIIRGELPARFVWKDDTCVAFMSINPLRSGHVLVVPRVEVDHWIDLTDEVLDHVMRVSKTIGKALDRGYRPAKVGMMLAGLEVPHVHVHVVPIEGLGDLNFANAEQDPAPEALDAAAEKIRSALEDLGHRSEVAGGPVVTGG